MTVRFFSGMVKTGRILAGVLALVTAMLVLSETVPAFSADLMGATQYDIDYGRLLPGKTTRYIIQLNVGMILREKTVVDLILGKLDREHREMVEKFREKMCLDLSRDLSAVLAFGGLDPVNDSGVLIRGRFDESLLKDYVLSLSDYVLSLSGLKSLHTQDCMGVKIYRKDKEFPGGYAFLDKDVIMAAPLASLEKSVELKVGWDTNNLARGNPGLMKLAGMADGSFLLWAAAVIPEKIRESSVEYHSKLKLVDSIFLSVKVEGGLKAELTAFVNDRKARAELVRFFRDKASSYSDKEFFANLLQIDKSLTVAEGTDSVRIEFYLGFDSVIKLGERIREMVQSGGPGFTGEGGQTKEKGPGSSSYGSGGSFSGRGGSGGTGGGSGGTDRTGPTRRGKTFEF